jgi:hypothetical protein
MKKIEGIIEGKKDGQVQWYGTVLSQERKRRSNGAEEKGRMEEKEGR